MASRHDPSISAALASVLQPHEPLPTREAAANALRELPCMAECITSILHYLERVWQGELNYEDRSTFAPGFDESVKADLAKNQEALYQTLYGVLQRENRTTIEVLIRVYGLATDAPSKFAIDLLSRARLSDACPALLRSEMLLKQSSADSFRGPREELEATLHLLKCK